jgi:hypothetical protein
MILNQMFQAKKMTWTISVEMLNAHAWRQVTSNWKSKEEKADKILEKPLDHNSFRGKCKEVGINSLQTYSSKLFSFGNSKW